MTNQYYEQPVDEISMRAALNKPDAIFGMEPFLALFFVASAGVMVFIFQHQLSIIMAALIVLVGVPWLRRQGKIDPQWSSVVTRSRLAQTFYPATSYVNVPLKTFRKQQRVKKQS